MTMVVMASHVLESCDQVSAYTIPVRVNVTVSVQLVVEYDAEYAKFGALLDSRSFTLPTRSFHADEVSCCHPRTFGSVHPAQLAT